MSSTTLRDEYEFGSLEQVSWFTRFLWWCAAADPQIMINSPNSDRVKLQGIGGMVLATGVIAFISGAYAFYTVFSPKEGTALALAQQDVHWPSVLFAVAFGMIWSLVIFNIDRFIVGSTGKGDGTDAITLGELSRALPRIAMATVIGISLSAPLEIRILKSEIEAQLELEQSNYLAELDENDPIAASAAARKAELRDKIDAAQERMDERANYFEKRRLEVKEQLQQLELEEGGRSLSGRTGQGPAYRSKKATLDKLEGERQVDLAAFEKQKTEAEGDIESWEAEIKGMEQQIAARKNSNRKTASHLDGLLKRIQISHEIGGYVPLMIALLLLCIEVGPIFFKMMVTKGAYDYLEEDRKWLILARAGIEPEARIVVDEKNRTRHLDRHLAAEAILNEEKGRLETEARLSAKVRGEFEKRTEQDIEENLDDYLVEESGKG